MFPLTLPVAETSAGYSTTLQFSGSDGSRPGEGIRDPEVLAELARGRPRVKIPALKEALAGRFGAHDALIVGTILSKLEFTRGDHPHRSEEISAVIAPFEPRVALLETIPGVDRPSVQSIVADMVGHGPVRLLPHVRSSPSSSGWTSTSSITSTVTAGSVRLRGFPPRWPPGGGP